MSRSVTFASARRRRTAHLLAQGLLILTLVAGLNYLATSHAWRFDLSRHARHSLSAETRSYLAELSAPVTVVVTFTESSDEDVLDQAFRDIRTLLRDYVDASASGPNGPIKVEYIDVFKNRSAAQRHGIEDPNRIFVLSENRHREIRLEDIYRLRNGVPVAFTGEQAFTSAILDVTRATKQKIYFILGHGEMDPFDTTPDRGLSLLAGELGLRNFDVQIVDLPTVRALPPDAALLVIAGTQGRYSPAEQELLRRHLTTQAGRLLLLLQPGMPHGLDYLLDDWGVLADDVLVVDPSAEGRADTGDLVAYPADSTHPVISFLFDNKMALRFGPSRVVRPDPGRSLDPGLSVLPLVGASPNAWGERSYRERGRPTRDATDLLPPPRLSLGTASERVPPKGALPFSVRGGRLLVFGDADWIANQRLAAGGNAALALAAVNWLADRDAQLALPPRPIERFQLSLTSAQLGRLRLTLLLALPAAAALLGLLVYWNRRR
jgi:hypothetical protein